MEDSGVIDLKAIHEKATAEKELAAAEAIRAKDPLSAPPPAFTMELPEPDEEQLAQMAKARRRPVYIAAGGIATVLCILGIAIAATGGTPEEPKRTAAVQRDEAPPPAATTAIPTAEAPPPPAQPATPTPAPPSTGVKAAPVAAKVGAKPAMGSRASAGFKVGKGTIPTVKMQKVTSSGVSDPKH